MGIYDQIMYFFIYSFTGWILESIYATYLDGKFVNRGFLKAPFCPLYGFAALIIIQIFAVIDMLKLERVNTLILGIIVSIVVATLLEYLTGTILEKAFNIRWWDYSDELLNLDGQICFKYSLLWGVLAFIIITGVQPLIALNVQIIPENYREILSVLLIFMLLVDTVISTNQLIDLRKVLDTYEFLSLEYYRDKVIEYKRFFFTFPFLLSINEHIKGYEPRRILNEKIEEFKIQFRSRYL